MRQFGSERPSVFYCGDDADAKAIAASLIGILAESYVKSTRTRSLTPYTPLSYSLSNFYKSDICP
ncbi:MAG: hypothetical protein KME25_26200 [Symplocastrum torsivum CPER-KK1]|jgi:predicted dinucleotide-binding enzyme|uniref:Uncharacterized protein n=1 Tax=Symplocastrum torsivum CPER-KK1 TaxID=450513 RepID=A0A951UDP4_9CYAN|nr:hypothetical protein [Symplocastrum torsivum CPER-KK1]